MQIVIDIQDDVYRVLKEDIYPIPDTERLTLVFKTLVKKGTPLPKGHGRLVDADTYRKEMLDSREFDFFKRLDMQPTIIEADKDGDMNGKTNSNS